MNSFATVSAPRTPYGARGGCQVKEQKSCKGNNRCSRIEEKDPYSGIFSYGVLALPPHLEAAPGAAPFVQAATKRDRETDHEPPTAIPSHPRARALLYPKPEVLRNFMAARLSSSTSTSGQRLACHFV